MANDKTRDLAQKVVDCAQARAIKDWDCLHMYLSEAAQMARQLMAGEPENHLPPEPAQLPETQHEQLTTEINEQARLLAMSAERELKLQATIESQRRTIESMQSISAGNRSTYAGLLLEIEALSFEARQMAQTLDGIYTSQSPGAWRTPELCALILKHK